MAMKTNEPSYESFLLRGPHGRGVAQHFLDQLVVGEPVKYSHSQTGLRAAARREGIKIACRIIDGQLWVARLKPEDVRK